MMSTQRTPIILVLLALGLSACSATLNTENLLVPRGEFYAPEAHLVEAVSLGAFNAGLLTREPLSKYIDAKTFRRIIEESLRNNGYLSSHNSGRYVLDVDFINMASLGVYRLTGTCMIEYVLTDTVTQSNIFREKIEARHVENFRGGGGHARGLRAREGAIRKNVEQLILKLSQVEDIE